MIFSPKVSPLVCVGRTRHLEPSDIWQRPAAIIPSLGTVFIISSLGNNQVAELLMRIHQWFHRKG